MDAYEKELEKTASFLQSVPGRFTEKNVKSLATLSHFETFEEDTSEGRRITLSGSIVVIDIDLVDGKPHAVSVSLASSEPTENRYSFMSSANNVTKRILESLKRPRLDRFAATLEFLSRCDRYSTKAVDCFQAFDRISEGIFIAVDKEGTPIPLQGFGVPEINPSCLGIALWYYGPESSRRFAYLDIQPGARTAYALTLEEERVQSASEQQGEGATKEHTSAHETRAELHLRFDPPIIISKKVALELNAVTEDLADELVSKLNARCHLTNLTVQRHPLFHKLQESDTIDFTYANLLPFSLTTVSHVPLSSPAQVPDVLDIARKWNQAIGLVGTIVNARTIAHTGDTDLSIADVQDLRDKPIHFKTSNVTVSLQEPASTHNLLLEVVIPDNITTLSVYWESDNPVANCEINKPINKKDLDKIISTGNLPLAVSYILGSLGIVRQRGSMSISM